MNPTPHPFGPAGATAMIHAAFAAFAVSFIAGASVPQSVTPPAELDGSQRCTATDPRAWLTDEAAAFARARQEHKPVVIDFYVTWSIPSQELECALAGPDVAPLLANGFVPLRFDVSDDTDEDVARKRRYGVASLPHLVVIDIDAERVRGRLDHLADGPTIHAFLERSR